MSDKNCPNAHFFSNAMKVFYFGSEEIKPIGLTEFSDNSNILTIPYSHLKRADELDFLKFTKVVCGEQFCYFSDLKGLLYAFGKTRFGELQIKGDEIVRKLKRVRDPETNNTICSDYFSVGKTHVLINKKDDDQSYSVPSDSKNLTGWGSCMSGELGIKLSKEAMVHTPHKTDINLVFQNMNQEHLMFHDKAGYTSDEIQNNYVVKSFFCGNECSYICVNDYLLGVGNKFSHDNEKFPMVMEMKRGIGVKTISCGESHTVMVDHNGAIYTWGNSEFGKLGHPNIFGNFRSKANENTKDSEKKCFFSHSENSVVKETDHLDKAGQIVSKPTAILSLRMLKIKQAVAGSTFTLVLTDHGEIFSIGKFGERRYRSNELDYIKPLRSYAYKKHLSNQEPNYKKICCGQHHAAAIDEEGNAYFWGKNFENAQSIFDGKDKPGPTIVDEFYQLELKAVDVSCGRNFSVCIFDDINNKMKKANYLQKKHEDFERIKRKLNIDITGKKQSLSNRNNKKNLGNIMKNTLSQSDEDSVSNSTKGEDFLVINLDNKIAEKNFGMEFELSANEDVSQIMEQQNQELFLGDNTMSLNRSLAIKHRSMKFLHDSGDSSKRSVKINNDQNLNLKKKAKESISSSQLIRGNKKHMTMFEQGQKMNTFRPGLNSGDAPDYSDANARSLMFSKSGVGNFSKKSLQNQKTAFDESGIKGMSQAATTARITRNDQNVKNESVYDKMMQMKTARDKYHSVDARFNQNSLLLSRDIETSGDNLPSEIANEFSTNRMRKTQSSIRITNAKFNYDKLGAQPKYRNDTLVSDKASDMGVDINGGKSKILHQKNYSIPNLKINEQNLLENKVHTKTNEKFYTKDIDLVSEKSEHSDPIDIWDCTDKKPKIRKEILKEKILEKYAEGRFDNEAEQQLHAYIVDEIEQYVIQADAVTIDAREELMYNCCNLDIDTDGLNVCQQDLCRTNHDFSIFMDKYIEIKAKAFKNKLDFDTAFIQELLKDLNKRYFD